jgi:hypothetical protein
VVRRWWALVGATLFVLMIALANAALAKVIWVFDFSHGSLVWRLVFSAIFWPLLGMAIVSTVRQR